MSSDIQAVDVNATGTQPIGRSRVKGFNYVCTATAGSIVLRDGGAGGSILLTLATPPVAGAYDVSIPGDGMLFEGDLHVTLTNVTSATFFYG